MSSIRLQWFGNIISIALLFAVPASAARGETPAPSNDTLAVIGQQAVTTVRFAQQYSEKLVTLGLTDNGETRRQFLFDLVDDEILLGEARRRKLDRTAMARSDQNYPNPFNPSTVVTYAIPNASRVTLAVYNILGQKIASLFDGDQAIGTHSVAWNGVNDRGASLSSGVYLLKMQAGSFTQVRKMMLAR